MSNGNVMCPPSFSIDDFNKFISMEQILRYFGIKVGSNHKILCLNHKEKTPSCHVYDSSIYCFGCRQGESTYSIALKLRQQKDNKKYTFKEMAQWVMTTTFPAKSSESFSSGKSKYLGCVPDSLVEYWTSQMTDGRYQRLFEERLITPETAKDHRLGWRPDYDAWAIPYLDGKEAEIIQFRMTNPLAKTKYVGLEYHQRGAVMNKFLLDSPQDYLIVLFGAFDGILAYQDGLPAVSLNGSMPFRKDEKERVQSLFSKQHTIFIVPDNTEAEYSCAYKLAEWLDAEVRFFPTDLPEGTDYIDYRKMGHTSLEFKQQILGIEPVNPINPLIVENVTEYVKVGDPKQFASVHVQMLAGYDSPIDIAREVAKIGPIGYFYPEAWYNIRKKLWRVVDMPTLVNVLDGLAPMVDILRGTW